MKLLLATTDSKGKTYYDSPKIWIDNHHVITKIYGFKRFNPLRSEWEMVESCSDILMSWGKIRIIGIAWDALIDPAYPATLVPNDNFDGYALSYRKQFFIGSSPSIAITTTPDLPLLSKRARVPHPTLFPLNGGTIPEEADAEVLAE